MTQRLYHVDAYLREFEAVVTAVRKLEPGGRAVTLDQTAFYPAAGGQPPDTGWLDGLRVIDVRDEDGEIWHVLQARSDEAASAAPTEGARVAGVIDWDRRVDHMQHHTGQHILSQAFLQALSAQTVSVHMGQRCTIDLSISGLSDEQAFQVERVANTIVMEHRPIIVREVDPDEAARLGLRRPPRMLDRIRVIEVEGFDRSACGGTHVRTAAEVGAIAVRGWEGYKGGVRIEFLCGWRALQDYRWLRGLVGQLAGQLTTGESEVPAALGRLRDRAKELERELTDARGRLIEYEAAALINAAAASTAGEGPGARGEPVVVAAVFDVRPADEVRALARAITARAGCVAILGVNHERRVLVARSAGVPLDAAAVLRPALAAFGGRGGGKPEVAEGVAGNAPSAAALVEAAREAAREATRRHRSSTP